MLVGAHWSHYMEGGGEKVGEKDHAAVKSAGIMAAAASKAEEGAGVEAGSSATMKPEPKPESMPQSTVERAERRCRMDELIRHAS